MHDGAPGLSAAQIPVPSPRYFRDAIDSPIPSADASLDITFQDVNLGDYEATCLMDTIVAAGSPEARRHRAASRRPGHADLMIQARRRQR
jgi:hypothetical protein